MSLSKAKQAIIKSYKALENTIMTKFANNGCAFIQVMTNQPYTYYNKTTKSTETDNYRLHRYAHCGAHIAITNINNQDYNVDANLRPSFTQYEDTKYYFLSSSVYYCNSFARSNCFEVEKTFNIREDTVKAWISSLPHLRKNNHLILLYDKNENSYLTLSIEDVVNDYTYKYLNKRDSQLEDKYIYLNEQGKRIFRFDLYQTDYQNNLKYRFKKCVENDDWKKNRDKDYKVDISYVGNILWRRQSIEKNLDPHRCCGYPVKAVSYINGKKSTTDLIFDSPLMFYNKFKNKINFSYKTFFRKLKEYRVIGIEDFTTSGERNLVAITLDLKYKFVADECNIYYVKVKNTARKYNKPSKIDIFNTNSYENYTEEDVKKFNMPVCVDKYSKSIEKGVDVNNAEYIITAEWTKEYKDTVDIEDRDRKSVNMRPVCFVYESDKLNLQQQKDKINKLLINDKYKDNIFSVTYSGNKSYHILVYINEKDRDIVKDDFQYYWKEVAKKLFGNQNLKYFDKSCASIAKLSRKPGGIRSDNNTTQSCFYLNRNVIGIDLQNIINKKSNKKVSIKNINIVSDYSDEKTITDLKNIYNKTHNNNCGTIIDILETGIAPAGLTIGLFGYLKRLNGDFYGIAKELYDIVHTQHKSCFPKKFEYYYG